MRAAVRRHRRSLLALLGCLLCASCSLLANEFGGFLDAAAPEATGVAVGRPDPDAGQR